MRFAAEVVATTVFWGLWAYVITPLVSLLLWFAGVQVFVEQMITLGGYQIFFERLMTYGLVVLVIMLTTFAWVTWNLRRYGARNTRTRERPAVTLKETAAVAGLDEGDVRRLQKARRVMVDFDDGDGLILLERRTGRRRSGIAR